MEFYNFFDIDKQTQQVAHPDLDWEASSSSPGHTNDFKNGTYCSSACAGHNELE